MDDDDAEALTGQAVDEALAALDYTWGDAYEPAYDEDRGWHALRLDGLGGLITGADPGDLHREIAADYAFMPVRRVSGPGGR